MPELSPVVIPDVDIVYTHNDWIVVNKPCGFAIDELHPAYQASLSCQLYPVHRLDKDTSGLWLLAKTPLANQDLSLLFQEKLVQKAYLALVPPPLKKKQGKVCGDMAKSRRGSYKLLRTMKNPAETLFGSVSFIPGLRLALLLPTTGKTHQLRVALKSLGSAILGDRRYGEAKQEADRLYLHAFALRFQYHGHDYSFSAMPVEGEWFSASYHAVLEQKLIDIIESTAVCQTPLAYSLLHDLKNRDQ